MKSWIIRMKVAWLLLFLLTGMASILCGGNPDIFDLLERDPDVGLEISNSLIRIDARVHDKEGKPVKGLESEDFTVYQDGRLQAITEFHEISPENRRMEPRIIVFIIDDLGLEQKKYGQVRTAIKNFADNVMQPEDIVGLARTAGNGMVFLPLTRDAAELAEAVDRWQGSVEPERPETSFRILNPVPRTVFINPCFGPDCIPYSQTLPIFMISPVMMFDRDPDVSFLNAVVNIAGDLIAIPHRKAVILFSDNDPDMKQMELRLADQMIRASAGLYQCALPGWRRKWSGVAENTGGYAVKAREDSFREIEQVLEDHDHCYFLAYEPDPETLDKADKMSGTVQGTTAVTVRGSSNPAKHSLKIKTNVRGVKVRTRSGFSSSLLVPKTDSSLLQASGNLFRNILGSTPFISGNLDVTAEALAFFSPERGNSIHVTVHVDGKDLVFGSGDEDGHRAADLEVAGLLIGNRVNKRSTGQVSFTAPVQGFEQHRKASFDTSFEMQAPMPGLYSLRATVRQRQAGKIGNASILVEVPDTRRSGLVASGIVTYNQSERPDSGKSAYTITRKIRRADPFGCYLQVYNARRDKSSGMTRMEGQFRLYRDNNLVKASEVLPVQQSAASNIITIHFDVHAGEELPAGRYLLEILIVDLLADKKKNTVVQSVAIELLE